MYDRTVTLLNSLTEEEQKILVETLKDKCHTPQEENATLKDLFIRCFGEDEEEVYFALIDEVDAIKKMSF